MEKSNDFLKWKPPTAHRWSLYDLEALKIQNDTNIFVYSFGNFTAAF